MFFLRLTPWSKGSQRNWEEKETSLKMVLVVRHLPLPRTKKPWPSCGCPTPDYTATTLDLSHPTSSHFHQRAAGYEESVGEVGSQTCGWHTKASLIWRRPRAPTFSTESKQNDTSKILPSTGHLSKIAQPKPDNCLMSTSRCSLFKYCLSVVL